MHPLLFRIPLPTQRLALPLALAVAGVLGVAVLWLGVRGRSRELALAGGLGAVASLAAALWLRDRVLVLGGLPVPAFGALLALALVLGAWLTLRSARRDGLPREPTANACAAALVGGILGARLSYVLLHLSEIASVAHVFAFRDGGLTAHGAVLGGLAAAFVSLRRDRTSAFGWLDAAAPGFALGVLVTRLGCWLEGCDYGRKLGVSAPGWLARLGSFPSGSRAWIEQVSAGDLSPNAAVSLPVHPAELYEVLGAAALLALTLSLRQRQNRRGQIGLLCLAGYGLVRTLADAWRTASAEVWAARVLALLGVAVALYFWRARPSVQNPVRDS